MKYIIFDFNNTLNVGVLADNAPSFIIPQMTAGNEYTEITEDEYKKIDGEYFNAYEYQNKKAVINISKAKEIQKNKFRKARKPILEKLDVEFMRALEAGDAQKQQEIATKKQELRDVTNTSLPNDLEGIKNTWPDVLNS